jgi:hypothetical protein
MSDQRIDSGELRNPKSKFGKAKKTARGVYDSVINRGVSECDDPLSVRRLLEAAATAMWSYYRPHRDPNLDHVRRVVNPSTGRQHWELSGCRLPARSVRRIQAAEKDYEKNRSYLESWLPNREKFARTKYGSEKLRGGHVSQQSIQPLVEPIAQPLVEPVVQSLVEPVVQPLVEPLVQPRLQPAAQPVGVAQPVGQPPESSRRKPKPPKRSARYERVDKALCEAAEIRPSSQMEIFQFLDRRNKALPPCEPFRSWKGWIKGFRKNEARARAWLSKRWALLELSPLPRGPKQKK